MGPVSTFNPFKFTEQDGKNKEDGKRAVQSSVAFLHGLEGGCLSVGGAPHRAAAAGGVMDVQFGVKPPPVQTAWLGGGGEKFQAPGCLSKQWGEDLDAMCKKVSRELQ